MLRCELPEEALAICARLCEEGVSPDALASVVCEIQNFDPHQKVIVQQKKAQLSFV